MADANPAAAHEVALEYGVEAAATVTELLARRDIDAVVIAVPSGLHADVTVEALTAYKHVYPRSRSRSPSRPPTGSAPPSRPPGSC